MFKRTMVCLLLAVMLVSCGPTPTLSPTDTAAPTEVVTEAVVAATDTPTPTETAAPTETLMPSPTATIPVAYGPNNFPADINPLTGLQVSDTGLLDRRPLGIKVNIYPRWQYRPPWGLNFADIVYEYYHNDGASRLHAIYYGQDAELVGSIRSGRLLDDTLVRMFKSIFVYGGADSQIDRRFWESDYFSRIITGGFDNPNCPPSAAAPLCIFEPEGHHNLIGSTSLIHEYAAAKNIDDSRQNLDGMSFGGSVPANGTAATQVDVRFSFDMYSRWTYDPTTGQYLLARDTASDPGGSNPQLEPLIDQVDNQQVGAENVVVLIVRDDYFQRPPNEIVEIYLLGTGTAYAFRDGQAYQVTWNHPTQESMLYLTFPDGSQYALKPGSTWFQVVNPESAVSTEGSNWSFVYNIRP